MLNKSNRIWTILALIATILVLIPIVNCVKKPVVNAVSSVINKDRSHTEITTLVYHTPEAVLNNLDTIDLSNLKGNFYPEKLDFSQYPNCFIADGKSYSVYQYTDIYDFGPIPEEATVSKQIQEDFELAKEVATRFIEQHNLNATIANIKIQYGTYKSPNKISRDLCRYINGVIYFTPLNFNNSDMDIVVSILSELLKAIQEQSLGKIPCTYFNEYMSTLIAEAMCYDTPKTHNLNKPCFYFIKAVGSDYAIKAYLFGFDELINSGKISENELGTFISLIEVINSSLVGQSDNHRQYLQANNTSDLTVTSILAAIAYCWETR